MEITSNYKSSTNNVSNTNSTGPIHSQYFTTAMLTGAVHVTDLILTAASSLSIQEHEMSTGNLQNLLKIK